MPADGTREFDFTGTTRLIAVIAPVAFAAWIGTAAWTTSEQPRWFILDGAIAIAIGGAVYGWIAWTKLVRRATLDARQLRVVTASGREHVIELADLDVGGLGSRLAGHGDIVRLRHPGGELYVIRPPAAELVDLLDGSRAWE